MVAVASVAALLLAGVAVYAASQPVDRRAVAAEKQLKAGGQAETSGRRSARSLLDRAPYRADVIAALAQSDAKSGQSKDAVRLMTVAGNLTWRNAAVDAWLLQYGLQNRNFTMATQRADALARVYPETRERMYPLLVSLAGDSQAIGPLGEALAEKPPWRADFMAAMAAHGDPSVSFQVLSRLNQSKGPPDNTEISAVLLRMFQQKQFEEAGLYWLLLQPPAQLSAMQGTFNGDFAPISTAAPFDWAIYQGPGSQIGIVDRFDRPNDRALQVIYDGASKGGSVFQSMILTPGPYRLQGEAMYAAGPAEDHLRWIVYCEEDGRMLLNEPLASPLTKWTPFQKPFIVPEDGCKAQRLELRHEAGDRRTTIEAWYDKLVVVREGSVS